MAHDPLQLAGLPMDVASDGLAAARHLRAQGWSVPVVAMTAHALADDRAASLDAGMDEH